ncbi:FZD1-like protein [Mya arenaria]|uniref:FZD1-like protein n=1 Tax=Mya arenaria TaxID=6604 RepID=A0ABY7F0J3_MYAAR|nr:FZD1-like protein [Mya arenaria]
MDYGCSVNFRQFVCSLYLPRYDVQDGAVTGPCKEMCNHAKRKCNRLTSIRRNRDANCFGPWREPRVRRNQNQMHMYCSPITLDQCQDLHYVLGSLPNRYLQRNISEIQVELNYYNPLIATSCHANLRLFLCGTFNPFCVHNENPFTTPCREFCEEVEGSCADSFALLYGGLPWPNKLQCHRFPAAESGESAHCFMPNDLTISR